MNIRKNTGICILAITGGAAMILAFCMTAWAEEQLARDMEIVRQQILDPFMANPPGEQAVRGLLEKMKPDGSFGPTSITRTGEPQPGRRITTLAISLS